MERFYSEAKMEEFYEKGRKSAGELINEINDLRNFNLK
jgi:hypothetical protein